MLRRMVKSGTVGVREAVRRPVEEISRSWIRTKQVHANRAALSIASLT